jgi:hypothetical protein
MKIESGQTDMEQEEKLRIKRAKRAAYARRWRREHPEQSRAIDKRRKKPENINPYVRASNRRLRLEVLYHYGTKCACCGVDHFEFLVIDHIDGGGKKQRREQGLSGSYALYRWLRRNNYPPGYRVLCHNCNFSLGIYGYCPHDKT